MKLGIIGLPNVGKSTLFNALTGANIAAANYPFCTIDPNIGISIVPDERLDVLDRMHKSTKKTPAYVEFADIAGLVAGASKGEGLGNKFLSHIREVDAVVHVLRCFEGGDITHVNGSVDPIRDLETINLELIYSDIELLERRADRLNKALKGDRSLETELRLVERVIESLNEGHSARELALTPEESDLLDATPLLSRKKIIYAANLNEWEICEPEANPHYIRLRDHAASESAGIIPVCAGFEAELAQLSAEDRVVFMEDLGIKQTGFERLTIAGYELLGLISFFTAGPKETRAWTVAEGTRAPGAAGKIHTDFERGFIRAEVVAYDDLIACGDMSAAKEKGLVRSEGKEYAVKDGDVILFRFNV